MKFSIILLSILVASTLSINANRLKKKKLFDDKDPYSITIETSEGIEEFNKLILDENVTKTPKGLLFTGPSNAVIPQSLKPFLEVRGIGNDGEKPITTYMLPTVYIKNIHGTHNTILKNAYFKIDIENQGRNATLMITLPKKFFELGRNRRDAIISGIKINKQNSTETYRKAVEELQPKVDDYITLVNDTEVKNLSKQEKEARKADLTNKVKVLESSVTGLEKQIKELEKELRNKQFTLSKLNEENNKKIEEIENYKHNIVNLDKDSKSLEEEIKAKQEAKKLVIDAMKEKITELNIFEPQEGINHLNGLVDKSEVKAAFDYLKSRKN